MFTIKQRKPKITTIPPRPRTLHIATIILKYIAIWVLVPMLLGFHAMLAILYIFNDGPSEPRAMGAEVAHSDWVERDWIGNATSRWYTVIP
ncbi:hypothetical protein PMIN01_02931 [Paraphaeosphaeria minitans]|uniref:Uncharacterized protein n=1 Tax=Paraphaeosphaeria minitans TaxID=565426 RepID=A0A9P6GRZ1_9PLEO|nr:hypothetical protein PMIN01_02931 [Paraphaeosphaeria minitans]